MKLSAKSFQLLNDIVSVYDPTKTTVQGHIALKSISGKNTLGPALNLYHDFFTDTGVAPLHGFVTANNRLFIINAPAGTGLVRVSLYNIEPNGANRNQVTFVGMINCSIAGGTQTMRSIVVQDAGTSGWRIALLSSSSVAANGGLFIANNIALSDFVQVSIPTIPAATTLSTNTSKVVFFAQETGTHLMPPAQGMGLTSSGDIIVGSQVAASFTLYRFNINATVSTVLAGGITTDFFTHKTGTISGISGTILPLNSMNVATPGHGPNAGHECIYIGSTTNGHLARISDIASSVTNLPSMSILSTSGDGNEIALTATHSQYSTTLDAMVFYTANGTFFVKRANQLSHILSTGNNVVDQLEGTSGKIAGLGPVGIGGMVVASGRLVLFGSTAGQRVVMIHDMLSHHLFEASFIVTKVLKTPNSQWKAINILNTIRGVSSTSQIYYRTSGFGSISGGWALCPENLDLSQIASAEEIQLKIMFSIDKNPNAIFAQLEEVYLEYQSITQMSENWEVDHSNTTDGIPTRTAFRLKLAYDSAVPELVYRAHDTQDPVSALVLQENTSAHDSKFEYSVNDGASWSPISPGPIPNIVGTRLRYNWTTPPGIDVRPSLREE